MKFNRQTFIDETCGNLDESMDCIEILLDMIENHVYDDRIKEDLKKSKIFEFIDFEN